jgi:dephospho-CoA kinase
VLGGGLASGKSVVRRLLSEAGVSTIDADSIGHFVLDAEGPAFDQVATRWPHVVREGEIHRPSLAAIVFNDPTELTSLEAITHPHIFDTIRAMVEEIDGPVVVEVPLLSHGLGDDWCRIVVDASDEARLERAVERGMSREDATARMAAQPSRGEWLASADLVIPNNGTVEELESTVGALVPAL